MEKSDIAWIFWVLGWLMGNAHGYLRLYLPLKRYDDDRIKELELENKELRNRSN